MDFDSDYLDDYTIENDFGSEAMLRSKRIILDNPLAEMSIDDLLRMPAHEIHRTLAELCNKQKHTFNIGQTAATTQIGRVVDPTNRKNLVKVDVKPARKMVDLSEYMESNLSDYGLDIDCPIISNFEEDEAPYSDFDVGSFTHTHSNVSDLRKFNSGPISKALANAGELVADLAEVNEDSDAVAEALEKMWGVEKTLRESGIVPKTSDRSIKRQIAEHFKNSYYVYGNEGQLSMFVGSTAIDLFMTLPERQALDFHRMRYIARAACYLDYISTASAQGREYYHTAQHYFGYRVGQVIDVEKPLITIVMPANIPKSATTWLPESLMRSVQVDEQVRMMSQAMPVDYMNIKDLVSEIGEAQLREIMNTTLNALNRSIAKQPGFGAKTEHDKHAGDIMYSVRGPRTTAANIPSTQIVQLLVNALTANYEPGSDGLLDGWFKEGKKIIHKLYEDTLGDREMLVVVHKLTFMAVKDIVSHMADESTRNSGLKVTKADIMLRMQGWIARIELPRIHVPVLTRPWFIAALITNKVDGYINKLSWIFHQLEGAMSSYQMKINMKSELLAQVAQMIHMANKHMAYFADVYSARGSAMRELNRVHSPAYNPGLEYGFIHGARFMKCVKFKIEPDGVAYDIDMVEARKNILSTLKQAKIVLPTKVLQYAPKDMFDYLMRTIPKNQLDIVKHLKDGYEKAVKYLTWRHHDLMTNVAPALKELQTMREKRAIESKRKSEAKAKRVSNIRTKKLTKVTYKGATNRIISDNAVDAERFRAPVRNKVEKKLPSDNNVDDEPEKEIPLLDAIEIAMVQQDLAEVQRGVSLGPSMDHNFERYARELAEKEALEGKTTYEDSLTGEEIRWAERNGVDIMHIVSFNAEATANGSLTLVEMLDDNPDIPPSLILKQNLAVSMRDITDRDINM